MRQVSKRSGNFYFFMQLPKAERAVAEITTKLDLLLARGNIEEQHQGTQNNTSKSTMAQLEETVDISPIATAVNAVKEL